MTTCSKYGNQIKYKVSFQRLMQLAPTLTLCIILRTLTYQKPRNIHNPQHIQSLEYSKSRRYLDACQAYCIVFDAPSETNLDVWQDSKYAYVSINATQLVQLFQVLFQAYSDILGHCSRAYSRILRTLCIPGIFRTLAYSYHKAYSDSKAYS